MDKIKRVPGKLEVRPEDAIIDSTSDFSVIEAYKSIRTNIMYSMPRTNAGKAIVLTSSISGEGKTTTCINLALTFAQVNAKVLLIDCDLRRPKIHRYLKLEKKDGLSNVLCGFAELEKAIKRNVRDNLDVLTAGDNPPNPAELLQTEEYGNMIKYLQTKYDYIIIDTPPIDVVTDATIVMKHSTGVILLIKKGFTTYDMLDDAMENIERVDANIIGTIMIDCKDGEKRRSYYGKIKYGHRYKDEPAFFNKK